MNKKQKAVCWVAAIVFFISICNAPWQIERYHPAGDMILDKQPHTSYSQETSPIWSPPNQFAKCTLQFGQLVVEWAAIAASASILIWLLKSKKI